jgi:putative transposase
MVSPAQRRAVVAWAETSYRVSQHRACRALLVHRSLVRYRSVKASDAPLRQRLHELAAARPSFGVKRLQVLLRREGVQVNHKKIERLYRAEGLQLRPRKRRRRAVGLRQAPAAVTRPDEQWAMDFMHDTLGTGQVIRIFTLVDVYTRECLALAVAPRFTGSDVARLLTAAQGQRGTLPARIQCDNGTEFTSLALDRWAYWNQVTLVFSRPGKPVDNTVCEAFNGSLRRECLTRHWFASLLEAQTMLESWRVDYNHPRSRILSVCAHQLITSHVICTPATRTWTTRLSARGWRTVSTTRPWTPTVVCSLK